MALSTYADLKTAVASWLNRTDLTTTIVDCVTLAEGDIRLDVRCQAMEQVATGTLAAATLAHPTRYLEGKLLYINSTRYEYVTEDTFYTLGSDATNHVYTSIGQTLYILGAAVGQSYTLIYYQGFAAFSGSSDTNWLLTNYPSIYLSAACRHGAHFLKDYDEEARWAAMYAGGAARVKSQQMVANQPGPLRVIPR
jgi:hypothetical protein